MQHRFGIGAGAIERAKQAHCLVHGQLFVELRFLQRDPDALAQITLIFAPALSENLDVPGVGRGQPLEDLDRRRFAGAVRA